jgi:hypothetical protein
MHRIALLMLGAAAGASAHDGHGPIGTHLHASDAFGFVVLAVAIAAGLWWRGRR